MLSAVARAGDLDIEWYPSGTGAVLWRAAPGLTQTLYAIVPDVQHFWVADSLGGGGTIPTQFVARATIYALTYVAFVLTLGSISFKTRDLG